MNQESVTLAWAQFPAGGWLDERRRRVLQSLPSRTISPERQLVSGRADLGTSAEALTTAVHHRCWRTEEFFHGRTIGQFLTACGVEFGHNRISEIHKQTAFAGGLKEMGASFICQMSRHSHGACLTYGAISELSTVEGYGVFANRTENPILAEILRRLAKDERRHFAFCYNQAKNQLQARNAERLTTFIIKRFWLPVGGGKIQRGSELGLELRSEWRRGRKNCAAY
jgi:hypothetical protein